MLRRCAMHGCRCCISRDLGPAIAAILDAPSALRAWQELDDGHGGYGWDEMIGNRRPPSRGQAAAFADTRSVLNGVAHMNELSIGHRRCRACWTCQGQVREMQQRQPCIAHRRQHGATHPQRAE